MPAAVLEYCEGPEGRRFLKGVAKPSPLKPGLYDLSGFFSYPGCKLGRAANSEGTALKAGPPADRPSYLAGGARSHARALDEKGPGGYMTYPGFFCNPGYTPGRAANSEGEERKVQSVSQRSVGAKAEQGRGGSWRGLTAGCPGEARVCRRLRRPSPHQSPHPKNPESMGGSVAHCVCVCRSLCVRVCVCV